MIDQKKLIEKIDLYISCYSRPPYGREVEGTVELLEEIKKAITAQWIPCSERLPEDLAAVNITWTNHLPAGYYAHIKDVHFTDTGIFYKGRWYWWSARAEDMLAEYGNDELDEIDDGIEVLAWQYLPEPWEGERE